MLLPSDFAKMTLPAPVMPVQFTEREARNMGERALMLALLEDAFRVLNPRGLPLALHLVRPVVRETLAWFDNPRETWGSFRFVCDLFGFDAEWFREAAGKVVVGKLPLPRMIHQRGLKTRIEE